MASLPINRKNIAKIQVENYHQEGEWWQMLCLSLGVMFAFLACGCWCIYAARKIKEEESVYHFEGEFMPDDENPSRKSKKSKKSKNNSSKRSNAGSDMSVIEMEGEEGQKEKDGFREHLKVLARSLVP